MAALGAGLSAQASALAAYDDDGSGPHVPRLFAGGFFTQSGTTVVNRIAQWTGSDWAPVSGGFDNACVTLHVFDDDGAGPIPPALYAGGAFQLAGGQPAARMARWNGVTWSQVTSDIDSPLSVITGATGATGSIPRGLYVLGNFLRCGGVPAQRIAIRVLPVQPGSGDGNSDGRTDGDDISRFLLAAISDGMSQPWACAFDMDGDGLVTTADLPQFVGLLLQD